MHGFIERELAFRFRAAAFECARVEELHRHAFAVVHVGGRFARRLAAIGVAQLLEELLRVLAVGARETPGEVASAADEHVWGDRCDDPLGVHPRPVQVGLHHYLRVEVAELGAHHGHRMPAAGVGATDQQEVRGLLFDSCAAALAAAAEELTDPGSITTAPGVGPVGCWS